MPELVILRCILSLRRPLPYGRTKIALRRGLITERSEVYTLRLVDRVFVRFLCELLKLRSCLLEGVQLHRRLQGCQTK
ncbi:MAG: hypothetical protein MJE68_16510 [Proteobacteria bacterium]|nr:hypothetical protein [Pseudomonadota bacterium]